MTQERDKGAVVITGASTGIGKASALWLDKMGFKVFAGVRKEADGEALHKEGSERLTPLMIDVTDEASITAAVERVRQVLGDRGLVGLVNNAGIGGGGPLEFVPLEDLRYQFEVNVIGQVAVIQAFMPLLRQERGRIVNMSSIGGRSSLPFFGSYTASKFALEALSDALRVELRPWGMHVALIEPGEIATPIWQKALETANKLINKLPPQALELYGPALQMMRQVLTNRVGISPDEVAKAVAHALTAKRPKIRYLIGRDAQIRMIIERLPNSIRDRIIASQLPNYGG